MSTVTKDNYNHLGEYLLYKKKAETPISRRLQGPIKIVTREGSYTLDQDWIGRVAIDSEGYPYPLAEAEFLKIYDRVS